MSEKQLNLKIHSHYDPPGRRPFITSGKTRVQQHFREECDINNIVKSGKVNDPFRVTDRKPQFGDFASVPEYQEAQNLIVESLLLFESLPSRIRARFQNDPVEYLAFVNDQGNYDEAVKLGMIIPTPTILESEESTPPILGGDGEAEEPAPEPVKRSKKG